MYEGVEIEAVSRPDPKEFLSFYRGLNAQTTLTLGKLEAMASRTFCFVVARREGELIGMARGVTDGVTGYLSECKLDAAYQGPACVTRRDGRIEHDASGIAREMADRVIASLWASGVERIEASAYGTEVDFCEELGFQKVPGVVTMSLLENAAKAVPASVSAGSAT